MVEDFLALDLSKSRTGWARWKIGDDKPIVGSFQCGDQYSREGDPEEKLWVELTQICIFGNPDSVGVERPADVANWKGGRPWEYTMELVGLARTAAFFSRNRSIRRFSMIEKRDWFPHFIGTSKRPPKGASKSYCMEKCQALGLAHKNDDEADALGILDYMLWLEKITPPWRAELVLV